MGLSENEEITKNPMVSYGWSSFFLIYVDD